MFNIVIFGAPGSGKGTQSDLIIDKYKLIHLSTGDLLRKEKNSGTELGKQIKEIIDKGNLVPNEMIQKMVRKFITDNKNCNGFIFDGFPRTTAQAQWLDQMLDEINTKITLMLTLDVDEEELKKRIMLRGKVSGRADDANEQIVENRIKVYKKQTAPVMDYYKQQNKFYIVNGTGELNDVFDRVCLTLNKLKN